MRESADWKVSYSSDATRTVEGILTEVILTEPELVIVDYLQRLAYDTEREYAAITRIVNELQDLTLAMNVPLVCLSQLSRPLKGQEYKPPTMSDTRGSGAVEEARHEPRPAAPQLGHGARRAVRQEGPRREKAPKRRLFHHRQGGRRRGGEVHPRDVRRRPRPDRGEAMSEHRTITPGHAVLRRKLLQMQLRQSREKFALAAERLGGHAQEIARLEAELAANEGQSGWHRPGPSVCELAARLALGELARAVATRRLRLGRVAGAGTRRLPAVARGGRRERVRPWTTAEEEALRHLSHLGSRHLAEAFERLEHMLEAPIRLICPQSIPLFSSP